MIIRFMQEHAYITASLAFSSYKEIYSNVRLEIVIWIVHFKEQDKVWITFIEGQVVMKLWKNLDHDSSQN
jgi:hypothetical protein